ncbi:MAG: hypothetical protein HYT98_02400 [Candidatus Sungbacteria bacterium]|nr:hypothetical protein [Candidatus Sungbacteria bacterium]
MKATKWWQSAIFYELYVDKFADNFRGLAERLDYLQTLGITAIHILPHYPSPMVDDGYDVSDYRNIRPGLGTLRDFELFIREAKQRGIHVILDLVLNHVSQEHPWFKAARDSKIGPKRDFFLWSDTGEELKNSINTFPHLKSRNWVYNPATNDYYFATFYGEEPDLNWNNPKVFSEISGIMDFWINLGVSGFRLDAAPYLIKKENAAAKGLPETHAVLKQIRAHLEKIAPHTILLAEAHDSIYEIKKYFGDGTGDECHLAYNFPLAERIFLAALKNDASLIKDIVNASENIPMNCRWAVFLRSHDQLSFGSMTETEQKEFLAYCDPERKFVFKSGENGISMRIADIFKKNPEKIKTAFDILFNLPGCQIIYYGDEIGMKNDTTIGVPRDTRRHVRGKFDWDLAEIQQKNPDSLLSFIKKRILEKKKT